MSPSLYHHATVPPPCLVSSEKNRHLFVFFHQRVRKLQVRVVLTANPPFSVFQLMFLFVHTSTQIHRAQNPRHGRPQTHSRPIVLRVGWQWGGKTETNSSRFSISFETSQGQRAPGFVSGTVENRYGKVREAARAEALVVTELILCPEADRIEILIKFMMMTRLRSFRPLPLFAFYRYTHRGTYKVPVLIVLTNGWFRFGFSAHHSPTRVHHATGNEEVRFYNNLPPPAAGVGISFSCPKGRLKRDAQTELCVCARVCRVTGKRDYNHYYYYKRVENSRWSAH